jgi:hypothetical protein
VPSSSFAGGSLQPLLSPKVVHPPAAHRSAFPPQQAKSHPPALADVFRSDLAETTTLLPFLDGEYICRIALCPAFLTHHALDPTLGFPVPLLQDRDGPPATLPAQQFPSARSLCIAIELRLCQKPVKPAVLLLQPGPIGSLSQ